MTLHALFKRTLPLIGFVGVALVTGCNNMNIAFGEGDGVPLAELDMAGAAPTEIALAGPDHVVVREGSKFDIEVSGDERAADLLRFSLEDDALAISRENGNWRNTGTATVHVTVPILTAIVVAGSGDMETYGLTGASEATIAGSGTAKVMQVNAQSFEVTIAGSGDLHAAGQTEALELTIAGSGTAELAALQVGEADVSVAGSGDAEFASDGRVDASIMGSGTVTVNGRASCTVNSMGSGTLNCRSPRADEDAVRKQRADEDQQSDPGN